MRQPEDAQYDSKRQNGTRSVDRSKQHQLSGTVRESGAVEGEARHFQEDDEKPKDRAQGVELAYEGETFRFMAMYHDGFGTDNTSFNMEDTEFAITARIEALLSGSWSQFEDFEGWPGGESGVLVGAAVHYEKEEFGTSAGPKVEDLRFTGDIGIEFNGANLFGAVVYQSLDGDASFDA